MKRNILMALLVWVVAVGAHTVALGQLPPMATVQEDSAAIPNVDQGDIAPRSGATDDKPRTVSPEGIAYLQKLRKNTPFGTNDFDMAGLRAGMGTRVEPTIKDVQLVRVKVGELPCEWVLAPGADPKLRLLYLHGGGWVSGSGGRYLRLAAHISAAAKCAVLLPDYRLAPEHPFPAGLEDCISAHEWLIANGPSGPAPAQATFIAGDSAGGNLTLATLLALRDRKLPLPAGGIPISPATDFTLASESLKSVIDPIISARTMPVFRDHYLGKADPQNPLASPVFGDYRGIPPLLIQVGEHEMLLDDSVRVAKKARADGISVKLEVWPGMFHVFQSHEPLLPEAREAIDHIADFMAGLTGKEGACTQIDVSERIEKLGNPLAQRYPDGSEFHDARNISDLKAFDGKLYVGHGDWADNSGPTDIWYFDLHKKEFVKQGQIEDEAADHYRVINGSLYVPGTDPQDDWSLGNFYRLENEQWVKHRTLLKD